MYRTSNRVLILMIFVTLMMSMGFWFCEHRIEQPMQAPTPGKIVINEVLYNPVGSNAGNQLVELKNIGSEPVELNCWWFCARQDYAQIPNVSIGSGEFLIAHIRTNGTNTSTDVFLPSMLILQSVSDLNLYRNANFTNPASIVHFVQWGGVPPFNRESEAVSARLWTAGDFIPGVADGHSIEYDGEGHSASDWFDQANPTIGF